MGIQAQLQKQQLWKSSSWEFEHNLAKLKQVCLFCLNTQLKIKYGYAGFYSICSVEVLRIQTQKIFVQQAFSTKKGPFVC